MKRFFVFIAICLSSMSVGAVSPTGTLPIVYVNTKNSQAITDTETQIPATVYIDPLSTGLPALGSASAPLPATAKGRGNWTWTGFDKKPYKIKFDTKQSVLGMPNNRHWCLMAGADDWLGFLRMPLGFMLSEAVGLRWTPRQRPVELVLNGQYMGLYFLTEHVRIAGNRIRIREQEDNETDASLITGGWLVEIDNYWTDNNFTFTENNGHTVWISLREPEVLSSQQRSYLELQLTGLHNAIQGSDAANLAKRLDIDEAAKFYLVQEIMEDCESYHGSCFLYKDRDSLGIADKWKFGPVWDFGNAYNRHQEEWIYINPTFDQYWIEALAQFPDFQQKVKENWYVFYHEHKDSVRTQICRYAKQISTAAKNDAQVWDGSSRYCNNSNMTDRTTDMLNRYDWRINWLYSKWGEGIRPATYGTETVRSGETESRKIIRNGQIYIIRDNKTYTPLGMQVR